MSSTVVNVRNVNMDDPDAVYIGRLMPYGHSKVRAGSVFGNPFKASREADRAKVIEDFESLMQTRLTRGDACTPAWWRERLKELDGKRLACWCAPKACHGDVLVRLIDELKGQA